MISQITGGFLNSKLNTVYYVDSSVQVGGRFEGKRKLRSEGSLVYKSDRLSINLLGWSTSLLHVLPGRRQAHIESILEHHWIRDLKRGKTDETWWNPQTSRWCSAMWQQNVQGKTPKHSGCSSARARRPWKDGPSASASMIRRQAGIWAQFLHCFCTMDQGSSIALEKGGCWWFKIGWITISYDYDDYEDFHEYPSDMDDNYTDGRTFLTS